MSRKDVEDLDTKSLEEATRPAVKKPDGITEKRFKNGKSYKIEVTWMRGKGVGELPNAGQVDYAYDESDAICQFCQKRGIYTPDCRFKVSAV